MSSDVEQKINDIHDIVMEIKANSKADKKICDARHLIIDVDIAKIDKVLNGNGMPGLRQRFDRLEARVVAWTATAVVIGQIMAPIVKDWVKR